MDRRIIILVFIIFLSCGKNQDEQTEFYVVTTTGMIKDAVLNIAGDQVKVDALMGPGIDPHLYKATQGDLRKLRQADLILYNGLFLEGKMGEVLDKLSRTKPVIAVAEGIPDSLLLSAANYADSYDPHIWFDVQLWQFAVKNIGYTLMEALPSSQEQIKGNLDRYLHSLDSLHQYVKMSIQTIPVKQRVLITAHDAFGYFGEAYDIEVKGLQGLSTLSEPGIRDIKELVDFITENNIKAVFVETSVSERAINAVVEGARQRGFNLKIGGSLYSDAMGEEGTSEGTYIGMVQSNVETITKALK